MLLIMVLTCIGLEELKATKHYCNKIKNQKRLQAHMEACLDMILLIQFLVVFFVLKVNLA